MIGDTVEEMHALYIGFVMGLLMGMKIALICAYLHLKRILKNEEG
jgi:hypothetical protein